jgi:hypothetical protein
MATAERIEAFTREHLPEVVLTDWQRGILRNLFPDPACTCTTVIERRISSTNPAIERRRVERTCPIHAHS